MTTTLHCDDYLISLTDEELDNDNFVDLHILRADTNEPVVSLTIPIKELMRAVKGYIPEDVDVE